MIGDVRDEIRPKHLLSTSPKLSPYTGLFGECDFEIFHKGCGAHEWIILKYVQRDEHGLDNCGTFAQSKKCEGQRNSRC
jgi:hypothetical protein